MTAIVTPDLTVTEIGRILLSEMGWKGVVLQDKLRLQIREGDFDLQTKYLTEYETQITLSPESSSSCYLLHAIVEALGGGYVVPHEMI